jgi:hypothetical protein
MMNVYLFVSIGKQKEFVYFERNVNFVILKRSFKVTREIEHVMGHGIEKEFIMKEEQVH